MTNCSTVSLIRPASEVLPTDLFKALQSIFPARRVEYIAHVLTATELRVIGDLHDAVILARIKRMSPDRLARFDRLTPRNEYEQRLFQLAQAEWINGEKYLLGTRFGRPPTERELIVDFGHARNGQRFRAYYAMKYPERMRRCSEVASANMRCCTTSMGR